MPAENMTTENLTADEFDPGEHTVAEVVEHIDANPDDTARILEAEQAGKSRKGVLEHGGTSGPTDYLGQQVEDGKDFLGREIEDGTDYLGRAVG